MRKSIFTILTTCALLLSAATLTAQQNTIMIQVMEGRSSVAVARHKITIVTGATPAEVKARKNSVDSYTDQRGILMMPIPAGTNWIQIWTDAMPSCGPHPEADSFSIAEIMAKGVQTPNKCSGWTVKLAPGHLAVYVREYTDAERATKNIKVR